MFITRQRAVVITAGLLPAVVFTIMFLLNFVSLYYGTINTVPFSLMLTMIFTWLLVSFPATIVGAVFGRYAVFCRMIRVMSSADYACNADRSRWSGKASFPCRVNSIPRPIPPRQWYSQPLVCSPRQLLSSHV